MNKKTFTLAVIFLCLTIVWFGLNLFWVLRGGVCVSSFDLFIAVVFMLAGLGMVYNEFKKKKRRHLEDVDKYKIP